MAWEAVHRSARLQHGLATTAQLLNHGLTHEAIRWAVSDERLWRVRAGVYCLGGVPPTQEQAWLAAVLAARGDAVLSHSSAAFAWGFRYFDNPPWIDLLVEGDSRPRLPGVRAHRTIALPAGDRTELRRVPITTAERTIVDVCGELHPRALGRSVNDALRRKLLTLPRLARCFDRIPASGRRKSGPMTVVLKSKLPGFDPGGSEAELDVMRVLRQAGTRPLPKQQHRIRAEGRSFRVDYVWLETKHVIEFDGGGGHDESTRHHDRERLRILQRAGFVVWPVTELTTRHEIVAIGVSATQGIRPSGR